MRLQIPKCGQLLKLSSDWSFDLIRHYDNMSLWQKLQIPITFYGDPLHITNMEVMIPKGTILTLKKIQAKPKTKNGQSRIYFSITKKSNKQSHLASTKFFASLEDANLIEFDYVE